MTTAGGSTTYPECTGPGATTQLVRPTTSIPPMAMTTNHCFRLAILSSPIQLQPVCSRDGHQHDTMMSPPRQLPWSRSPWHTDTAMAGGISHANFMVPLREALYRLHPRAATRSSNRLCMPLRATWPELPVNLTWSLLHGCDERPSSPLDTLPLAQPSLPAHLPRRAPSLLRPPYTTTVRQPIIGNAPQSDQAAEIFEQPLQRV